MSTSDMPISVGSGFCGLTVEDLRWEFPVSAHECRVLLVPESTGGYSAHALRLPGVVSQGETEAKALANVEEAFRGSIAEYRESGVEVPWGDVVVDDVPKGSVEKWLLVDNV